MQWIKTKIWIISGVLLGFVLGYGYWHFYGCTEGCTITSVWWRSSLYGSFMGGLVFSSAHDYLKKR